MSSAISAVMNKVDRERADILRAELARLCWLIIHDKTQDGESERLLQSRWRELARRDLPQAATPTGR